MLIELKNLQKSYSTKNGVTYRALSNVSTAFDNTGLVFLVGPSGSGKSTLLNVIGGLDDFDSGELILAGRNMRTLKGAEVDSLRNTLMGFIFQEFNLIDTLSVYENVRLALDMQSLSGRDKVMDVLEEMGIKDKANNKTKDLSGGQRQRVAIARALVKDPRIILADEPTGALDSATGEEVLKILKEMSKTRLVLVVTHDIERAAEYGDRIVEMKDGKIYRDVRRKHEGEVLDLNGAQLFSDTLMCLASNEKVTQADADKLNEIMKGSARKTFVNVDSDPRRIKAMFPNLREAVDVGANHGKEETEDAALSSDVFVPYKPRKEAAQEFSYKKSRLSAARAVRLGLNNLNYKKGRLILTVIMAFMAFALFGIAQSFTTYDVRAAVSKTIVKEQYLNVALINGESTLPTRITDTDFNRLKAAAPEVPLIKQYDVTLRPDMNLPQSLTLTEFDGIVEVDDISRLGLATLYGSSRCEDFNSVIVSEFAVQSLIINRALEATNVADALGRTVKLNDKNYRIAGIFDVESEKYGDVTDYDAAQKLDLDLLTGWGQIYVMPGFVDNYIENQSGGGGFTIDVSYESKVNNGQNRTAVNVGFSDDAFYDNYSVEFKGGNAYIESGEELFFGAAEGFLAELGISDYYPEYKSVEALNNDATRKLVLRYNGAAVFVSDSFKIDGLVSGAQEADLAGYSRNGLILHPDLKEAIYKNVVYPVQVYACLNQNEKETENFVELFYKMGFRPNAAFMQDYSQVLAVMSVLRWVLLGLAIVLCLLVVVLLFNFISTSIRLTKKQIGILRALGAKKSDTFKIYAIEGFLVTLFSLVLAIVLLIVGAPMLNVLMSGVYGYYFTLFSIGPVVYITMAVLALAVTLISVIIPLRKFNKITPISAISGKE